MRTVKAPQERREEFLDAAMALFEERGVDATSVSDIIGKVGVAKGTFYWHFKSKEALLDALAQRKIGRFIERLRPLLADADRSATQKLRAVHDAHEATCHAGACLRDHFHKPENLLLHQKHRGLERQALMPLLAKIIAQGNDEGLFDVPSPEVAADFLIMAQTMLVHPPGHMAATDTATHRAGIQKLLERALGAAPGSLAFLAHD